MGKQTMWLPNRAGPTQTGLYSHRRWLETGNFGFKKKRNCTIRVAKTMALISFAVTAKLICAFVFAYADCWFSHAAAQMSEYAGKTYMGARLITVSSKCCYILVKSSIDKGCPFFLSLDVN